MYLFTAVIKAVHNARTGLTSSLLCPPRIHGPRHTQFYSLGLATEERGARGTPDSRLPPKAKFIGSVGGAEVPLGESGVL